MSKTIEKKKNRWLKVLFDRDEVKEIEMYIEHQQADLRAHAKDVRRKTAQAEEDIKRILKAKGEQKWCSRH